MPAVQKILLRILDRNQMNAKFLIKEVKNYNPQIIRQLRASHSACISFWITKRQAISTDNGFIFK